MLNRRQVTGGIVAMAVVAPFATAQRTQAEMRDELQASLAHDGWQFVDNSGDGGPFGFHMKAIYDGRFVMTLSAGDADESIMPVTVYDIDDEFDGRLKGTSVVLHLYEAPEGDLLPTDPEGFMMSDLLGTGTFMGVFPNVYAAVCAAEILYQHMS